MQQGNKAQHSLQLCNFSLFMSRCVKDGRCSLIAYKSLYIRMYDQENFYRCHVSLDSFFRRYVFIFMYQKVPIGLSCTFPALRNCIIACNAHMLHWAYLHNCLNEFSYLQFEG